MGIDRVVFIRDISKAIYNGNRKVNHNRGKWIKAEQQAIALYRAEHIAIKLPGLFRKFDVEIGEYNA